MSGVPAPLPGDAGAPALVLGYGSANERVIHEGIAILGSIYKSATAS